MLRHVFSQPTSEQLEERIVRRDLACRTFFKTAAWAGLGVVISSACIYAGHNGDEYVGSNLGQWLSNAGDFGLTVSISMMGGFLIASGVAGFAKNHSRETLALRSSGPT